MKILYVKIILLMPISPACELRHQAPQLQLDVVDTLARRRSAWRPGRRPIPPSCSTCACRMADGLSLLNDIRSRELPLVVVILTGGGDEETARLGPQGRRRRLHHQKRLTYLRELPHTHENAIRRFETGQKVRKTAACACCDAEANPQDVELTRRHLARYASYIRWT